MRRGTAGLPCQKVPQSYGHNHIRLKFLVAGVDDPGRFRYLIGRRISRSPHTEAQILSQPFTPVAEWFWMDPSPSLGSCDASAGHIVTLSHRLVDASGAGTLG